MVARLGELELATVGLATLFHFIFWMIMFGFTSGTITYMAQFWGNKDIVNLRKVGGIAFAVCFSVGLLFFFATLFIPRAVLSIFTNIQDVIDLGTPFMRIGSVIFLIWAVTIPIQSMLKATQQTRLLMIISGIVFSLNTFLGFTLIFGKFGMPRLGLMGALAAVLISRVVELTLYLIIVFARKNVLAGSLHNFFSWNRELLVRVIKNSGFTTLNETAWGIGASLYSAAYGRISPTAFAAFQASQNIVNLFSMACFSLSDAILILVGEKLGEGDLEGARKDASKLLRIVVLISFFCGLLLFFVSGPVISLFKLSPLGAKYTLYILWVYSGMLAIKVLNCSLIAGVLRAGGDTKFPMITEAACVWLIGIPLAFLGAVYLKLPIYLAFLMVQTEEVTKGFIIFARYLKRKWVQNLVKDISSDTEISADTMGIADNTNSVDEDESQ